MKILVVEDDPRIAQTLQLLLSGLTYAVDIAPDGEAGLQMVDAFEYDLILLDVVLPGVDGVSLCQQWRAQGLVTPILLLTGQGETQQKAVALNAGADDYVVKPFDAEELTARVQALLRRGSSTAPPILTWGNLSLDPSRCTVAYGTDQLSTTPKEYGILELFLRQPQKAWSAAAILEHIWNSLEFPGEEAVRVHIKELRQKLAAVGAPRDFIKTVYRVGYRLNPLYSEDPDQVTQQPTVAQTVAQTAAVTATNQELRTALEQLRSLQAELQQKNQQLERSQRILDQQQQQLQATQAELERQMAERTADLEEVNQSLRQSEEQRRLALDLTHTGSWDWNIATGEVLWSDHMYPLSGLRPGEVEPSYAYWRNSVHPEDIQRLETVVAFHLAQGTFYEEEYRVVHPDGSIHWVLSKGRGVYNAAGQAVRMVGIIMDISDRNRSEAERQQTEAALRESDRRYATLTEVAPVGIFWFNAAGECTYVNPRWCELTGSPAEAAMGTGWLDTIHPQDRDSTLTAWHQWVEAGAPGTPFQHEARVVRPDGRIVWFYCLAVREIDADGTLMGYVGSLTDTSDRKQAELELQQREEFLSSIYHGAAQGIFVVEVTETNDFRYLSFNHPAEQMAGSTTQALAGKTPEEAFGATIGSHIRRHYHQCLQAGSIVSYEEYVPLDHRNFWALTILSPLHNDQGRIHRIVGTSTDISDRKQTEIALQQSVAKNRAILAALPDLMIRIGADEMFREFVTPHQVPHQALDVVPKTVDRVGRSIAEVLPADLAARISYYVQKTLQTGELQMYEQQVQIGDRLQYEEVRVVKSGDDEALLMIRDITTRKQAEIALRESEEKFRHFAENSHTVIWIADPNNLEALYVNSAYERIWGRSRQSLIEHPTSWLEAVHPDDRDRVQAKLTQQRQGNFSDVQYRIVRPDGSIRWIGDWGFAIRNEVGELYCYGGMAEDISDRKQAEQIIHEQAALLDIASDAIFVRDLDHRILYWNQGAERLYGWSATEAIGQHATALLQEDAAQIAAIMQTLRQQQEWQGEISKVTKAGKQVTVAGRWTLVVDEAGQPRSILTVNTDITEKKQLEAQFCQAQRLESLGTLASGIAHDLNNVLTPILAISQLLRLRPQNQDGRSLEMLQMLEESAQRGAAMVQQILTFARGSSGRRVSLSIAPLLQAVVNIVQRTFPPAIAICQEEIPPDLWQVSADPTQLHQVLMNLGVNARDAMPNGGRLTLSAENVQVDELFAHLNLNAQVGDYVVVTIADTGTGIPPEVRDRIFEPFFTTKAPGVGTGLGLSTSLGIIKNYGGFLHISSEVGQGTQVKVYLPAVQTTPEAIGQPLSLP